MSSDILQNLKKEIDLVERKLKRLTKEDIPLDDIVNFVSAVRTNPKNAHEPWSWEQREYLIPLYRDPHKRIIIVKARQMEITEFAVNVLLYYSLAHPGTYVYIAPRLVQVSRFSRDRLRRAILTSPKLKEYLLDYNIHRVKFGNSVIYLYTGWQDFDALRGIAADGVIFDEMADLAAESVEVAEEMLSHSQLGRMWMIGTPKEAGSRFEELWYKSDRKEYDTEKKMWIPKGPPNAEYSGYHIHQLLASWIPPEQIEYKKKYYSKWRYTNEVLGEFFAGLTRPITPDMLRPFVIREKFPQRLVTFAGIDWGSGLRAYTWFVAVEPEFVQEPDTFLYRIVYAERIEDPEFAKQVSKIARLIQTCNVAQAVVDIGFGVSQYQTLYYQFGDKVAACQYVNSPTTVFHVEPGVFGQLIQADRNTWIEKGIDLLQRGLVRIYTNEDPELEEQLIRDFSSLYCEASGTSSGKRWIHEEDATDDAFHAFLYAIMAHHLYGSSAASSKPFIYFSG